MKFDVRPAALITALATMTCIAAPAFAQSTEATAQAPIAPDIDLNRNSVTIGAGVASVPTYEGSDDRRIIPAGEASGTISGFNFSTRGTKLLVDIIRNPAGPGIDVQFGPVIGVNFNRHSDLKDPRIEALGRRGLAVELGGYAGIGKTGVITSQYDKLSASVSYIHDVAGVHDSYVVTPEIDYGTPLSRKAYIGILGSADYAGNGYAQTYFGVDVPGSIRSGLPVYNARRGWKDYSVSALGSYALTGDLLHGFSVVGGVSYSRVLGNFADSPVVRIAGKPNQWLYALGVAYTF